MSHPNSKEFLDKISTKENKNSKLVIAGGSPKSISGGAKAVAAKKKKL